MQQKHFIDSHKAVTLLVILGMIAVYDQWHNPTAWVYWAMHGGYGLLWVSKSRLFPDKSWEQPCSVGYALVIWGGLSLYWVAPYLITSQAINAPSWYIGVCLLIYILGIFLHYVADMQKYISLRLQPAQLIQTGMWARLRNPNYLGELLIYGAFALLTQHGLPMLILGLFVAVVWVPNILKKDRSLSRYPDFAAYRARSWRLIPWVW